MEKNHTNASEEQVINLGNKVELNIRGRGKVCLMPGYFTARCFPQDVIIRGFVGDEDIVLHITPKQYSEILTQPTKL